MWTIWNNNYNEGYQDLGFPEFTRPNLIPIMTKIGGHCILSNAKILDSEFAKFVNAQQEQYTETTFEPTDAS